MKKKIGRGAALALLIALGLAGGGCRSLAQPINWTTNPHRDRVHWAASYEAGIALAARERRPVCLVLYADWCPHCEVFAAQVMTDPRVIEASRDFVMIHVNADDRPEVVAKYTRSRAVPRVFFLTADGQVLRGAHAPRLCNRYVYDERDPASFLAGMSLARELASGGDVTADPLLTSEWLCGAKPGDSACATCIKASCCDELVRSFKDPAVCAEPPHGDAIAAFTKCLTKSCPQCPQPKESP